jgi:peptidoglycan/xylan/chitin deacetylase (PgdA/CDA1 family)
VWGFDGQRFIDVGLPVKAEMEAFDEVEQQNAFAVYDPVKKWYMLTIPTESGTAAVVVPIRDYLIDSKTSLFEDFENFSDWTVLGGVTANAGADTTHYKTGAQGLLLQSSNGSGQIATRTISADFSNMLSLGMWIYIDDKSKLSNSIYVKIYNEALTVPVNYFIYQILKNRYAALQNGWNFITMQKTDFIAHGSINWQTVMTKLRVATGSLNPGTVNITFDSIYLTVTNTAVLFEDFETLGDWTSGGGAGGGIAVDTVNYKTGQQSLKLTSYNNTTQNLSAMTSVSMWLFVDDVTKLSSGSAVLRLYPSPYNAANYYSITISQLLHTAGSNLFFHMTSGWNYLNLLKTDFVANGTVSWDAIARMRVSCTAIGGVTVNVSFDALYINERCRPKVIMSFDDGLTNTYSVAFADMLPKGLPGTVFAVGSLVGTTNFMTIAELQALRTAGWDIASHSYNHVDLTGLANQAAIEAEIQANITYLESANPVTGKVSWPEASHFLCYPFSTFNETVRAAAVAKGTKAARMGSKIDLMMPRGKDFLKLYGYEGTNTKVFADYKAVIDDAVTRGTTAILYFHDIVTPATISDDVTPTVFAQITSYLKDMRDAGLLDVVNFSEWYNGLNVESGGSVVNSPTDTSLVLYQTPGMGWTKFTYQPGGCAMYGHQGTYPTVYAADSDDRMIYRLNTGTTDATPRETAIPISWKYFTKVFATPENVYKSVAKFMARFKTPVSGAHSLLTMILRKVGASTYKEKTIALTKDSLPETVTWNCPTVSDVVSYQVGASGSSTAELDILDVSMDVRNKGQVR